MTDVPPLSATLPYTDYFEVDSAHVGDRFGVWVTRPIGYDPDGPAYPVLYTTDGNASAPLLAPYLEHLTYDLIESWVPFVHVAVGYPPESVHDWVTRRTRDLVPPGEAPSEAVLASILEDAEAGSWTVEEADAYRESIIDGGHADKFLAFLEEELRPLIDERVNVRTDRVGMFGFSYGGLFSLYALVRRSPMFSILGAGSPGVMHDRSTIFRDLRDNTEPFTDVTCHVTVTDKEFIGRSRTFRDLAQHTAAFINEVKTADPSGLTFSARILPGETHASGLTQSFHDFLRVCYSTPDGN